MSESKVSGLGAKKDGRLKVTVSLGQARTSHSDDNALRDGVMSLGSSLVGPSNLKLEVDSRRLESSTRSQ